MIDYNNKIVFVHIPKTGGSSINASLLALQKIDHDGQHFGNAMKSKFLAGHQTALEMKNEIESRGLLWEDFFKFSVVRHPFSRLLSKITWSRSRGHNIHTNTLIRDLKNSNFYSYKHFLFDEEENLMVDVVYKFEDGFDNIYNDLEKRIGKSLKRNWSKKADYLKILNLSKEVEQQFIHEFQFDFENFNYKKEIQL